MGISILYKTFWWGYMGNTVQSPDGEVSGSYAGYLCG